MKASKIGYNPEYQTDSPTVDDIRSLSGVAVLEFGAEWCGHCQAAMPAVESILSKRNISHIKVADGKGKRLGRAFKVKLWPSLILLKDGEEVARLIRPLHTAEVESFLLAAK